MDKLPISRADARFVEALRDLIRTGVMAAPGLEASPLIDLAVVDSLAGDGASAAKRAYLFIQVLQQVIKRRLEGKEAETANILFGFEGYAGVPIQDRYRAVAKLYNPHWTWENYRKEPLLRHLLTVYLALKREAEVPVGVSTVGEHPRKARSGLVGQDWILEQYDGLYTLPSEPGGLLEAIQTRRLRAVCEQIDTYRHIAYVREHGTSKVPLVTLLGEGSVQISDTYVDQAAGLRVYVTEVKLSKPVHYGETVDFTLLKQVDNNFEQVIADKSWDWYGLVALGSPAEAVTINVRFPVNKRPREVWRHEDIISGLVRPGEPTDGNRLIVDSSGVVSCGWSDLSAGYSYGVSLSW